MFRRFLPTRRLAALGISAALLMSISVPAGAAGSDPEPIIDGLAGPLGLAVAHNGTIYVGEAFAGRLTAVRPNGTTRVIVDEPGTEVAGVDSSRRVRLVITHTTFDGEPGTEAPPLDGVLARVRPDGTLVTLASLQDFENAHNPDGDQTYGLVDPSAECLAQWPADFPPSYSGIVESHPYAVAIVGRGYVVADAAANAIFRVSRLGKVRTLAVLPPIAMELTADVVQQLLENEGIDISECEGATYLGEPVPTDVEVGRDGYLYVSTLPGFPELPGAGAVWKVHRQTGEVSLVASGLAGPVDIALERDGTIWVAELFGFQISTIDNGVVTPYMFADSPGAIEVARDGTVYATTGVFGPNGALIQVTP